MIQDILPLHLQNQYEKKQPDDTSYMMIYRENKILVREGETLAFLTYRELREICETAGEMAPQSIYLFSVGEETYFLTELPEHLTPEGYCFEKMFAVRSGKPKEHILAAATAWHLYEWYRDNRFCGRCGQKLMHNGTLRMLFCPACGNQVFPKIAPEEFIADGSTYFRLELFGMVITFFNNVYIAIERARGNSKRILILNTAVIVVKLGLTAWFVYGLGGGINMISCATIISQSLLLLAACINMNQKGNAFGFSLRAISIKKEVICPMLTLSFPVIVERIAFAVGKVIVNSMSTVYGSWTVGALGISNNIGGITTNPQNGFQEGGSSIISQNLGAGRPKRALLAFRWVLYIDMLIGLVIMTASLLCLNQLAGLFAGDNAEFAEMIKQIYRFEAVGAIPLGVNAAVMALLYGFGKTRVTLVMNFCRVFLFRVPVLWALQQFTDLGNVSAGIVMAVSNVASGVLAAVVGVIEIRRICNTYDVRYFGGERKN